ncbi:MAG: hypothetical protein QOH96_891, partial [Blastocatellia bacterium]|nr:hypothetical protein [Blastocatellia bacterium]
MRIVAPLFLCIATRSFQTIFSQTKSRAAGEFYNRGLEKQAVNNLDGALADYDKAIEFD